MFEALTNELLELRAERLGDARELFAIEWDCCCCSCCCCSPYPWCMFGG